MTNFIESIRKKIHSKRDSNILLFKSFFHLVDKIRALSLFRFLNIEYYYRFGKYKCGDYSTRQNNIKKLKNMHPGCKCFILGSGPSANEQDLSFLKNEFFIAVNQSYLILKRIKRDPDLICLGDYVLYQKLIPKYEKFSVPIIFTTGLDGKVGIDYDGKNLLTVVKLNVLKKVWKGNFSWNIEKGVNLGKTIIIELAIPLAIYMGFKEIYLIGCDTEESGYAFDDKDRAISTEQRIYPEVFMAYRTVKNISEKIGVKIYTVGYSGKLNVFERLKLTEIRKK